MQRDDIAALAKGMVPFVREVVAEAIAEAIAKVPPPPEVPPIVPRELAEQVSLAVRTLHELPPIAEPKPPPPSPPPPPPRVIRIERDANSNMIPIYSEP